MSALTQSAPLWRQIQKKTFTSWEKLFAFLELDASYKEQIIEVKHFPLNLPFRLASKIEKNTWDDPLLKQFLPTKDELIVSDEDLLDPVGDDKARKCAKLLHKYTARALLVTSACAMHCRYCFRRNFPYETHNKSFDEELKVIQNDTTLSEIILSGGDPLSLSNKELGKLLSDLSNTAHIKKIRFHTRFPIGIPERIDDEFPEILSKVPKQIIFVVHINHPKELDEEVIKALKNIMGLGIPVINQSVLLRGINDNICIMQELLEALTNAGIIPYYLHQLDRAEGASHFAVAEDEGLKMIAQLTERLPGYAIPRYVKEIAGDRSKRAITSKNK